MGERILFVLFAFVLYTYYHLSDLFRDASTKKQTSPPHGGPSRGYGGFLCRCVVCENTSNFFPQIFDKDNWKRWLNLSHNVLFIFMLCFLFVLFKLLFIFCSFFELTTVASYYFVLIKRYFLT